MSEAPRIYPSRPVPDTESPRDLRAELNAEQAAAATFPGGPLLIIAGAGTGKTRTLTYRVADLLQRGVPAERILLLTFTRRAAQEMLARVERLVGAKSRQVHGGTFHATGHRLLRKFGASAGVPSDFTIMDQGDAEDLMQLARATLGFADSKKKRFPKKETLHYIYSRHINTDIPIQTILGDEYPPFLEYAAPIMQIYADYTERKGARNLVDYDDLLLFWLAMLEGSDSLGARIGGLYDHVLVDEYQDTNSLQARILAAMCRGHGNLSVVGDDAQSIYAFRGASFRNILDFPRTFPNTTIITLEENYRSTQPILDVSNTLISRATERYTKNLWTKREGGDKPWLVSVQDEPQQTRFVVERILELYEAGMPLREMAVLFRAGYMSADLEIELTNRKIPFDKWGGLKFLEAAHVKDILAFLRVLENPRDEVSWYRILMLLPGIGESTARGLMDGLQQHAWEPDAFRCLTPPARAREAHVSLGELLHRLRTSEETAGGVAREIARVRTLYDDILKEKYDHVDSRLSDLEQLQGIAGGYPTRGAFLAAIALEPPQSTQDLGSGAEDDEADSLVLSTVHSAKGKEWNAVFLIWAVDGYFPMSRSIGSEEELEEERRLMYVAMTRAKNHLAVTYPLHAYGSRRGADYSIDQLSRFIDREVRGLMERVVPQFDALPDAPNEPSAGVDLRAVMRGRFNGGSTRGTGSTGDGSS